MREGGDERARDTAETHLRPHLGEDEVDGAADDVVAPGLVVVPVRLLRQSGHALVDARPLRVGAVASHLGKVAEPLDTPGLELRIGDVDAHRGLDPGVEVGDPGVVLEDGAAVVELPERDLHGGVRDVRRRGGRAHLLQGRQGSAVVGRARIDHAAEQIDDGRGHAGARRAELGDAEARDGGVGRTRRRHRSEREEVLDGVLEAGEVADGVDAAGGVGIEEARGHGRAALGEDGQLVGIDGEVVDALDGPKVAARPVRPVEGPGPRRRRQAGEGDAQREQVKQQH